MTQPDANAQPTGPEGRSGTHGALEVATALLLGAMAVAAPTTTNAHPDPTQWRTLGAHCDHAQGTGDTDTLDCGDIILHCDGDGHAWTIDRQGRPMAAVRRDGRPDPSPWAAIAELLEIAELAPHELAQQDWVTAGDGAPGRANTHTADHDALPIARFARRCIGKRGTPPTWTWRSDPDPRIVTHPGTHERQPCTAITSAAWNAPEHAGRAAERAMAYAEDPTEIDRLRRAAETMRTDVREALRTLNGACGAIDGAADPHATCATFAGQRGWGWLARACRNADALAPAWIDLLQRTGVPVDDLPRR